MLFKNYKKIINNGINSKIKKQRKDILDILDYSIKTVDPYKIIKNIIKDDKIFIGNKIIDTNNFENIYLVGFGKASLKMGKAVLDSLKIKKCILITNEKKGILNNDVTKTYVASHPIPNQNSIEGTNDILNIIRNCSNKDLIIILISGGGSSLLCKPTIELTDLKKITNLLLKTDMNINEINTIRKHLSFVKGGQLIKDVKCEVISIIISDIVNDPIEFIASGPTYPDSTTFDDAKNILLNYKIWEKIPKSARKRIEKGIIGKIPETLKKDNLTFQKVKNFIILNNKYFCNKVENYAKKKGYETELLTTCLTGEARYVGKNLIENIYNNFKNKNKKIFISSGETTVNVVGEGSGGRNQEMVLGSVNFLDGKKIIFASFATDGIDGNCNAAGAIADGFTLSRALQKNYDPSFFLKNNNSYGFFNNMDDLLQTGPTGTNIMDIQLIIINK
jgi:hydroxypyruvate reductase/glycerate 2-kinase